MSRAAEAVILSVSDLGEADLLLSLFTKEHGLLRGVAKNARKSRLRFGGAVDRFSLVEVRFRFRQRSELVQLEECELLSYPRRLRKDLAAHASAALVCEAAESLAADREPAPEVHRIVVLALALLERGEDPLRTRVYAVLALLGPAGLSPVLDRCAACGRPLKEAERPRFTHEAGGLLCTACRPEPRPGDGTSPAVISLLASLRETGPDRLPRLKPSRALLKQAEALLLDFVRYHSGRRLPSAEFIERMGL